MHNIFVDIETLPTQREDARDRARKNIKVPANYKYPDSIAKWWTEYGDKAIADEIAKTSFDPAAGHICSIAWALNEGDVRACTAKTLEDEAALLHNFFLAIPKVGMCRFIGHYISGFDLRFIMCRAIVLGVKVPALWPRDPKPWDHQVFDTMIAWAGAKGTISLDRLCEALGIESPKGELTGAGVARAWQEGRFDEIAAYNRADVVAVREVFKKFEAVGLV